MQTSYTIPQGTRLSKYWTEGFKLKPRKKKFVKGNIEPRIGVSYWIYSTFKRCWYFRRITEDSNFLSLIVNINKGLVYWTFTEDEWSDIQRECEAFNLDYDRLNRFRTYQYSLDRHINTANKEYGYLSKKKDLEDKISELTKD